MRIFGNYSPAIGAKSSLFQISEEAMAAKAEVYAAKAKLTEAAKLEAEAKALEAQARQLEGYEAERLAAEARNKAAAAEKLATEAEIQLEGAKTIRNQALMEKATKYGIPAVAILGGLLLLKKYYS